IKESHRRSKLEYMYEDRKTQKSSSALEALSKTLFCLIFTDNNEELAFSIDPGVIEGPVTHMVITHNATYQADDLDAYDSEEKVFVITTLKNDLRKLKVKDIVDNATQVSNATTIALGMYKLDLVTLAPRNKNSRESHIYYLKPTMEQATILKEIVEQAKSLNPLDSASYSAHKYVKLIQEFLGYVRDTCPDIHKPSEKLVAVTPINMRKTVRFAEPIISSSTSQKLLGSS
nr:hypothetical protein [Tanacetum cinerariifolium]